MQNDTVSKYTISFGLSLALTSVINALLVVVKEKSTAVQGVMKRLTGHHWITHAAIIVILFIVFGWLFARAKGGQGIAMSSSRLIQTVVAGVCMAGLIIIGFYLIAG